MFLEKEIKILLIWEGQKVQLDSYFHRWLQCTFSLSFFLSFPLDFKFFEFYLQRNQYSHHNLKILWLSLITMIQKKPFSQLISFKTH